MEIAELLTADGYRAPCGGAITRGNVEQLRRDSRLLRFPNKSNPKRKTGFLTIAQLAEKLKVSQPRIYRRILDGTILVKKDGGMRCSLFPDTQATLARLRQLFDGKIGRISF